MLYESFCMSLGGPLAGVQRPKAEWTARPGLCSQRFGCSTVTAYVSSGPHPDTGWSLRVGCSQRWAYRPDQGHFYNGINICTNIIFVFLVSRKFCLVAILIKTIKSRSFYSLWSIGSGKWQAVQNKDGSYAHVNRWFSFLSSQMPFSEVGTKWARKLSDSQAAVSLSLQEPSRYTQWFYMTGKILYQ